MLWQKLSVIWDCFSILHANIAYFSLTSLFSECAIKNVAGSGTPPKKLKEYIITKSNPSIDNLMLYTLGWNSFLSEKRCFGSN